MESPREPPITTGSARPAESHPEQGPPNETHPGQTVDGNPAPALHEETVLHEETIAYLARPIPSSGPARVIDGAACPWHGLRYLLRRRDLWPYAILPILANVVITVATLGVLIVGVIVFIRFIHPWTTGDLEGAWRWLALGGEVVATIVMILLCGGLAILVWKLLSGVLCGFFYGRLTERVERALGVAPDEIRSLSLGHELTDTLINLSLLLGVNGAFFLLNGVPLLGSLAALIGSSLFTWYLLGLDTLSYPLALRGRRRSVQFAFGKRHFGHTVGLGLFGSIVTFIPLVGAVFLTSAVVGGVLLHRRLVESTERALD